MSPLILYFLKVNLALVVLYAIYRFLFQNDTFFQLRRITLLVIFGIAFLYPLPDIRSWISGQPAILEIITYYASLFTSHETSIINEPETIKNILSADEKVVVVASSIDWKSIIGDFVFCFYIVGVVVLLFRSMVELITVLRNLYRGSVESNNGISYCILPEIGEPHSFFKWIFINPEKHSVQTLHEILIHEETHVRQHHSFDVMIGQLVTVICWMNPFAWLLKQEISINHEYIADQEVMRAGFNKKEYQYHLIGMEHSPTAAAKLYNYFSVLPLKKRITMLNKKRTNRVRTIKYLALIPLAACLLLLNNMDAMARIVPEQLSPDISDIVIPLDLEETINELLPAEDDPVLTVADKMPQFPGGDNELLKYISRTVIYPKIAQENGIEGRVILSHTVEKDGSISNIQVVRSIDPSLDKEAIRVIESMPKWTPGENKGKVARVKYTVPIQFRL